MAVGICCDIFGECDMHDICDCDNCFQNLACSSVILKSYT